MFLNPDLKVFNAQIHIDTNDPALRSGMTCKAEIIVEQYDDAVYVPVQAVTRVTGDAMVYVRDGKTVVPRKVEIGLDNNRMIRIVRGLEDGEVVEMEPPLKPSSVDAAPTAGAEPNKGGAEPDAIDKQVRGRLDASRQMGSGPAPVGAGPQGMPPQAGPSPAVPSPTPAPGLPGMAPGQMPAGMPKLTPEQQKQMQEAMQKLTPEQRKQMQEGMQKAMKVMGSLSAEEKEKLMKMSREEQMKYFQEKMGGGQPK